MKIRNLIILSLTVLLMLACEKNSTAVKSNSTAASNGLIGDWTTPNQVQNVGGGGTVGYILTTETSLKIASDTEMSRRIIHTRENNRTGDIDVESDNVSYYTYTYNHPNLVATNNETGIIISGIVASETSMTWGGKTYTKVAGK